MEKTINQLISEEHERLMMLLTELEQSLQSQEDSKLLFSKFKWNLEKHFFLEEKAIFVFYNKISNEEVADLFDLMREHGDMINLLKNIEESLDEGKTPHLEPIKNVLEKHHIFEDQVFYPKLETLLNTDQKLDIILKIEEFLKG